MSADRRLIEEWLPIAEIGIESLRERRAMSALPPIYYLHVWWARRPLVACRAAILASLLPGDANRDKFKHILGIHGDAIAAQSKIDKAIRTGKRVANPFTYLRAFQYALSAEDRIWLSQLAGELSSRLILDPTAGGGSIPFEALRLGIGSLANDLNPVATLIMHATFDWPTRFPEKLQSEFGKLAANWRAKLQERLETFFPQHGDPKQIDLTYLWAHTITCPYCSGLVPLSPNWRLAPDGTGVRLKPHTSEGQHKKNRRCDFKIVETAEQQSPGTVAKGNGACPFTDCRQVIDGDEIKRQAQAGEMGEQLYAIAFKQLVSVKTQNGKTRDKWERRYRAPRPEDENSADIAARLATKIPEWEALDIIPNEIIEEGNKTTEPLRYGMPRWRDLFSPRQLLCHGTSVEIFREMLEADQNSGNLNSLKKAAFCYLAITLDTILNYNSRMSVWMSTRGIVANTFSRHDFAFCWSHPEMAPLVSGAGYDWAIEKTQDSIDGILKLMRSNSDIFSNSAENNISTPPINITCKSADSLNHIENESVDAVIMDPPYYDNVMYAELSDFFYVWLKRTAGHVFPDLFRSRLTDKESEAIANPARFRGEKGASVLAKLDYRERMARIFAECRRVLKPDGIMTLLFTHKATGAWDALTTGLMKAGFVITASWPINTEAPGSMHIRDKAAANSTIFLACRPRTKAQPAKEAPVLSEQTLIARAQAMGEAQRALFLQALQPRSKSLADLTALDGPGAFALLKTHEFAYDEKAVNKWLRRGAPGETGLERLRELRPLLAALSPFDPESIEAAVAGFCEKRGIGLGKAAQPLRVAVTGGASSPPLGLTLAILGQTETTARLDRCLAEIGAAQSA